MPNEPREIEIETLETPKGNVPTVKGLETSINTVYREMASFDKLFSQMNDTLVKINSQLSDQIQKIGVIGESLVNITVVLGKLESAQEQRTKFSKQRYLIEKADLVALKEDITRILEQLENRLVQDETSE
jgi:hypothetical protein